MDGGFKSDDQGKKITFDDVTRSKSTLSLAFADKLTTLYNPLQFHFHAPSEHTVDGKFYDLEVHFVHTLADQASGANKYTVYGVFFDVETGEIIQSFPCLPIYCYRQPYQWIRPKAIGCRLAKSSGAIPAPLLLLPVRRASTGLLSRKYSLSASHSSKSSLQASPAIPLSPVETGTTGRCSL